MRKSSYLHNAAIKYPNGMDVLETDMVKALDFTYGLDRDMDESLYTEEEKQRAIDYWVEKGERDYYQEWIDEQSYGRHASEGQEFSVAAFKSIDKVAYGWPDATVPQLSEFDKTSYGDYIAVDNMFKYVLSRDKFSGRWDAAIYDVSSGECVYESWDDNAYLNDAWHEMYIGFVGNHIASYTKNAFKSIEEVAHGLSDSGRTEVVFRRYIDQDDFEMYDWVVLSRGVNGELDLAETHAESSEILFSLEDAIFDFEWSPWADFFSGEITKISNKLERRVKTSGYFRKETYEYGGYTFIHTVDDDEDGYGGTIKHHMRVSFGWNARGDRLFATSVLDSNVWDIYYIPYSGWHPSDEPWYHYDEAINIDRVVARQDDLDDIMNAMLPYCPQVERSIVNKGGFGVISNVKDAGLPYRSEFTGWYVYFDTMPDSGGELRMSLNNDALNVYREFMDFDVPKKWNVHWGDVIDINPREYGYDDLDMYHMDAYEVADFVEYLLLESI